MRVVTWNLWWRFGPWRERQPAIAAELEAIDADLVLLQEVWADAVDGDQAQILADRLGFHVVRTRGDGGEPAPFANAILSRWPVRASFQLELPPHSTDRRPGRSAVLAVVDHPDGPQPVATTHLDWRYDASGRRQTQLDAIVTWFASTLTPELVGRGEPVRPLIFGGDLNAVPESDEVRRLVGASVPYGAEGGRSMVFTDAWAACGDGEGHTWTRDNPHSADAQWPRRRLDYLFSAWPRPKPTGNPIACRLGGLQPHDGVVPSDHAAVIAEFDDRPADPASRPLPS